MTKQIFEDAMFLDKNPEVENMLAQIYMNEGNYHDAMGLFADIDKKYPQNTSRFLNRGTQHKHQTGQTS